MSIARFMHIRPGDRLGIDIGRVLMCPAADDGAPDTSFLTGTDADAIATPAAPGMWETVPRLDHAIDIGLTHFIDDRADILEVLQDVVPALGLFGVQARPISPRFAHIPSWDFLRGWMDP